MKESIHPQKGYGLIGKTLTHSYSKEIHEALGGYSFELWELSPQELSAFFASREFEGAMVTIPYKKDALATADKVTTQVERIGAANILYFDEKGLLWADNTDYYGFIYMVGRMGLSFKGKRVLILGDGATSGMVCQAVMDLEAASPEKGGKKHGTEIDDYYRNPDCTPEAKAHRAALQARNGLSLVLQRDGLRLGGAL